VKEQKNNIEINYTTEIPNTSWNYQYQKKEERLLLIPFSRRWGVGEIPMMDPKKNS
jgi:hypothetical protein